MAYREKSTHKISRSHLKALYLDNRPNAVKKANNIPNTKEINVNGIVKYNPACKIGKKESLRIPIILCKRSSATISDQSFT